MSKPKLTAQRVRELFDYDPEKGELRWRTRLSNRHAVGDIAGCRRDDGTFTVGISGARFLVHRIVWLYCYGEFPTQWIDHANGNPSDNRICNLRLATPSQNIANSKKKPGSSKFKGVSRKQGRWYARVRVNYRHIYLGYFDTEEEAHAAYVAAAVHHFGQFARAA